MGRWRYGVWALAVLYLGSTLLWTVIASASEHGWAGAVLDGVLYVAALASGYAVYRWEIVGIWLLATTVAFGLILHLHTEFSGTSLFFLAVWLAPFRVRLWHAMVLTAVTTAGFVGTSLVMSLPQQSIFGIGFALGWAGFLAAVLNQLVVTRNQTKAVAEAQARTAVLGERQRLAREIHDILAHSLSAQVVHLEGARLLLEQGGDREVILDRVVRAGDLARAGLADSRRAVSALRGDQTPLVEQLELLADQFRSATGRSCEVSVTGDAGRLAPEAWLAVVRTAQEALTNAHKHAPEAEVMMDLRCARDWCELEVRDTGGHTVTSTGNGYGLVGMRERAELIGGTLDAGPVPEGFRVRLRVPA
ncbi:sensor histidine kinase [Kibdelosporangium persicum]|uniref:sensor histidine kinase n=1 Tax=Kibdelosporangium persicum TaxID=2698649 RepID=UPI001563C96B|nr:sensor histidine kinase [Kibdelosporangium persicum]